MAAMSPRTRSMRRQLIAQLVASSAILAAVLIFLFQGFARQFAEESLDNVLMASTTSILESVTERNGAVSVDIPYAALAMLGSVSDDRVFYRIDHGTEFLTGYGDLESADLGADGRTGFAASEFRGDQVRVVTASRLLSIGRVTVTVAQTQDGLSARLDTLFRRALVLGGAFFLLASGLSIWVATRAFRPLDTLARSVARRGPADLSAFAPTPLQEMVPLVAALNRFVNRLKRALGRSEDFITEAAHRVRTPLATVRTQAEVLMHRIEKDENRQTLRDMIRAVDESSRAAGQLLDQAMVNLRTDALDRAEVDLAACLSDVVTRLRPMADLRDISLRADLSDTCPISVDAILIQNALSNLLDNAIKYAPPETDVRVTTHCANGTATIRIEDGGPGFGAEDPEPLKERFVRGRSATGTVGSGLGLTIASQVFEAHGGHLTLSNREGGLGACVEVSLPRS